MADTQKNPIFAGPPASSWAAWSVVHALLGTHKFCWETGSAAVSTRRLFKSGRSLTWRILLILIDFLKKSSGEWRER